MARYDPMIKSQFEPANYMTDPRARSYFLVFLMFSSVLVALVGPASIVMANNETTAGTISGTEVWSGTHQLTGDITISAGAKLIVEPGTTVIFPNGTYLDVRGNLCAGKSSCGASGDSSLANRITFRWTDPIDDQANGTCLGMSEGTQSIDINDPSCFEGILIRSSIDLSQTGLRHMTFDGAWGIPYFIDSVNRWRYGVMVIDGAAPTLTEMTFTDINTSSVLTTNLAQPTFIGGEYVAGNDAESDVGGSAVQIYGSGTHISPLVMDSPSFVGTDNGCGQRDGGRPTVWAENTFIEINNANVGIGDYGFSLINSAGHVTNSVLGVNCNAIEINGHKAIQGVDYEFSISNNEITTAEGSGIYVYDGAMAELFSNEISGVSEASGISISSSKVNMHDNDIGPIGGWNGIWLTGSYDVIAERNNIVNTAKEPLRAGEFGNQAPSPAASRLYFVNNTITQNSPGVCSSDKYWGGDYTCPAVSVFRTGVTLKDNQISVGGDADGIRAIGAILDVQRNIFDVPSTGAIIKHYDDGYANSQQYGSLAFFSQNLWNGVDTTYNVTKSSVTVQSEYIPSPPAGINPVLLSWSDQEAWPANGFQNAIIPTPVSECSSCDNLTPIDFPLAVSMDNNSTTFTFANLSNLDRSKINIATQPTPFAVQVRRAEMVRFQTLVNGERVESANVLIEDALGNDIYSLHTDQDGYTPWFALPSDFHLDFRGLEGGNNPDGFADDEYEDSCSDGIDNDGDLNIDADDDDCDHAAGTRELSRYFYTAYKFGFGYDRGEFTLDDTTYQQTVTLVNDGPTVSVSQYEGYSFRRIVNFTGSAHDGQLAGFYATDELAQWDQQGYVHSIEIRNPFTGEWIEAGLAVDDSGMATGTVTRHNHPFSDWYYSFDMSNRQEGDYTFEFRAYDGIDYSPIISRTIKLNTAAPIISVTTPSDHSTWSEGSITFEGTSYDQYGCPLDCSKDIGSVYFHISGPNFEGVTPTSGGSDWSWNWDFSGQPRTVADYTFTIWASDGNFCIGVIDECEPVVLTLTVDNSNSMPFVSLISPQDGDRMSVGVNSQIQGVARDNDGEVSRIDITVRDIFNGGTIVHEQSVTEILPNGGWVADWDSTHLIHDYQYSIEVTAYDGYDYSEMTTIAITADNPPDAGNNQPSFDSANWVQEITLYCEIDSQSQDRCTKASIDLMQFFSDADVNQELILSVYNNPELTSDDDYGLVISVGVDGIAVYDPISMFFYDTDMDTWTLDNVVFLATDPHGSKMNSMPVTFTIVGINFEIFSPESNRIQTGELAIFTGVALPGKTVVVTIDGNPVNNTIVSDNSTWILGIPASRILGGSSIPEFRYAGEIYQGEKIYVGVVNEGMPLVMIIIISIVVLGLIGGAFAYFFVEFEEDEESTDSEDDGITEESSNEGWIWDEESEEWVEDPNYNN